MIPVDYVGRRGNRFAPLIVARGQDGQWWQYQGEVVFKASTGLVKRFAEQGAIDPKFWKQRGPA